MKLLLQNSNSYQLFAELRPIKALNNKQHELIFTSTRADSKNPDDEQVRGKFILDDQAIEKLKSLVMGY